MSLIEIENENYRRDVLSCLFVDSDFCMNEISLTTALRLMGNPISRDRLKTQLQWLSEQGLVSLRPVLNISMNTATLTQRGADVAEGLTTVPGVARMPL